MHDPELEGYTLRPLFKTDGSVSTGSVANDGRPFRVIRRLSAKEADPSEITGRVELFRIAFTDARGGEFTAWTDEIASDWPD